MVCVATAFIPPRTHHHLLSRGTTCCSMVSKSSNSHSSSYHLNNNNNDDDDASADSSLQELEKARQAFESMMQDERQYVSQEDDGNNNRNNNDVIFCPLTESDRLRRLQEMELLSSLEYSDDAIEELMHLWMNERDGSSAATLEEMQYSCSPGLRQEEGMLGEMVELYGGTWVEPASRLALLKYMQGDSTTSQKWCDHVLQRKPWHFETLHTQLLNQLRLEGSGGNYDNDASSSSTTPAIWKAARMTLPPLTAKNVRRRKWVQRAVTQAQAALEAKEDDLRRYQRTIILDPTTTEEESSASAWQ
eukprot:CAMPEP_0194043982 /NCGR_PEP_ID=MMETSP0009_2-20130614/15534_1 /TAXON_ID=210454 /ORGANISM="Grammatophora oceanica, Strain CCMP 410" /LENGTH=303 /DNA_ID=CAMNT_0038688383 /DNA_START=171 /DNA_END=1082 /DNA_ORIENTATION=+